MKHYQVQVEMWARLEDYDAGHGPSVVRRYQVDASTPEDAKDKAEGLAVKHGPHSQTDDLGFVEYPIVRGTVLPMK